MSRKEYNLVTILGPTASGKTLVAAHLAHRMGTEIISGDSRQVYRRMDLGTGKDIEDYVVDGKEIPNHLIDIFEPGHKSNVYEYQSLFVDAFLNVRERNLIPVLCGGSGLYIEAAIKGYKLIEVPENPALREQLATKSHDELVQLLASLKQLHNTTDIDNRKRLVRAIEIEDYYKKNPPQESNYPTINTIIFGIRYPRQQERERITLRLKQRLSEGMLEEVKGLLDEGIEPEKLIYYGLEYKWLTQHLMGEISYNHMVEKLNTAIHQFAKRQMTWFRRMEASGLTIHWVDGNWPLDNKLDFILEKIR